MFIKSSTVFVMTIFPTLYDTYILQKKHYENYGYELVEKQKTTLEYNYITTEEYIEQMILKNQDILIK
jgi:hypothetical protein